MQSSSFTMFVRLIMPHTVSNKIIQRFKVSLLSWRLPPGRTCHQGREMLLPSCFLNNRFSSGQNLNSEFSLLPPASWYLWPSRAASGWAKEHTLRCRRRRWKTFVGPLCSQASFQMCQEVQIPQVPPVSQCSSLLAHAVGCCWGVLAQSSWIEDALCLKQICSHPLGSPELEE